MASRDAENSPALRGRRAAIWAGLAAVLVIVALAGGKALMEQSPALRATLGGAPPPLPRLGELPAFSLLDCEGAPLSAETLRGRVWVADFIFTRCGSICPALSATMGRLQARLAADGSDVGLISFTVDPAHDTPAVLSAYAQRHHADPDRWMFATGRWDDLHRLIGEGFRLAVAHREAPGVTDPNELITHSDRLVLLDSDLQIRAYYRGTEPDAVEEVLRDLARLRTESGK